MEKEKQRRYIIAWGVDCLTGKPFTQTYYVGKATDKQARDWLSPTVHDWGFVFAGSWEHARLMAMDLRDEGLRDGVVCLAGRRSW